MKPFLEVKSRKHLEADPEKCTGCRICELVCSFVHYKVLNPARSRIRIERYDDGRDVAILCHNCEDAPCIEVCPSGALFHNTVGISVDVDKCVGCGNCMKVCPYGAIRLDPILKVANICDLCGECVRFCPPEALQWVEGGGDEVRRIRGKTVAGGPDYGPDGR